MSSALHWTDRIGRRIKLRDLHILMAVAQAGSMGKAAEALSVSQPVVSKSVAALEEALGKPLLDRGPHGVVPTLYGRALLESRPEVGSSKSRKAAPAPAPTSSTPMDTRRRSPPLMPL